MSWIRQKQENSGTRSSRIVTNFGDPYTTGPKKHTTYLSLSNFYRDKSSTAVSRRDRTRYGDLASEYAYLAAIYR